MTDSQDVLLIDPGLFHEGWHHASLARVFGKECERRGLSVGLIGADRPGQPGCNLTIDRVFRSSPYAPACGADPRSTLLGLNESVLDDARHIKADRLASASFVLLPTLTAGNALGLARWIKEVSQSCDAKFAAVMMFSPGRGGDDSLRRAETEVYAEAMAVLSRVPHEQFAVFAETEEIGRAFEALGGPRVTELPWPVQCDRDRLVRWPDPIRRGPVRVVCPGYSRVERGFALLPEIIESVGRVTNRARFCVQVHTWKDRTIDAASKKIEDLVGSVDLVHGAVSPADYANMLDQADIVLLPYDSSAYRERGSGVFADAAARGKVIVCPSATWMGEQVSDWDLGAVLFDEFDSRSVSRALLEAIDQFDELALRATAVAGRWREDRSAEAFLNRILTRFMSAPTLTMAGVA